VLKCRTKKKFQWVNPTFSPKWDIKALFFYHIRATTPWIPWSVHLHSQFKAMANLSTLELDNAQEIHQPRRDQPRDVLWTLGLSSWTTPSSSAVDPVSCHHHADGLSSSLVPVSLTACKVTAKLMLLRTQQHQQEWPRAVFYSFPSPTSSVAAQQYFGLCLEHF
jgi:hypothetical protein